MPEAISDSNPFDALGLTRAPAAAEEEELGMNQFLELMVTQLTNQDPTKPLDSQQFLGQIAQFTTVSGIEEMNRNISTLGDSLSSNQALEASSLVGRNVFIDSNEGFLSVGGTVNGSANLNAFAADVVVRVSDAAGQLVKELHLGAQPAGAVQFSWDGIKDDGNFAGQGRYKIDVVAESGGQSIGVDPLIAARVESVLLGQNGQGATLNLAGQGSIGFDQVRQIN